MCWYVHTKRHKVDFIVQKKESTLHNFSDQKGEKAGHRGSSVHHTAASVDSQHLLCPVIMLCPIWLHGHDE